MRNTEDEAKELLKMMEKVLQTYISRKGLYCIKDDLYEVGLFAITKAIQKFDETKEVKLTTFAFNAIAYAFKSYTPYFLEKYNRRAGYLSLDNPTEDGADFYNIIDNNKTDIEHDLIVREQIQRVLNSPVLGDTHRRILELELKGYTHEEIAEELNLSYSTVRQLKYIAIKKLRKYLKGE